MSFDFTSEGGRGPGGRWVRWQKRPRSELKPCEFYISGFLDSINSTWSSPADVWTSLIPRDGFLLISLTSAAPPLGGQCLTLAQNWVLTSRLVRVISIKNCFECLSSTRNEYLCWTLTLKAAHLCSRLVQWQGAINIACTFFPFLQWLCGLYSQDILYKELKLQSSLWRNRIAFFFLVHLLT